MSYAGQAAITPEAVASRADSRRRTDRARSHSAVVTPIAPGTLAAVGVTCDLLATAATIIVAGVLPDMAMPSTFPVGGVVLALLVVAVALIRCDYTADTLLGDPQQGRRGLETWLLAATLSCLGGALTRAPWEVNAVTVLLGAFVVPFARGMVDRQARRWALAGRLVAKRIMLVGGSAQLEAFTVRCALEARGWRLVCTAVLREEPGTLTDDLALAVATARMRQPDELILLLPWNNPALVSHSIEALSLLPATLRLGLPILESTGRLCVDAAAGIGVPLVNPPLSRAQRRFKRAFDLAAASVALVLLAPFFAVIAVAVKSDSSGPVFFRQRRTGYNGQPFHILKFRSMQTMEDGASLRQVTVGDSRVTRVGRLLRRSSLDELPQLVNVLAGEMSLIGPRPHALAHDLAFSRTHGRYPRRHAVKPGITGWAQVSGFRGETDTADKIEGRVRHDLAYVDDWSLRLDAEILLRTLFSPKTFQNAR